MSVSLLSLAGLCRKLSISRTQAWKVRKLPGFPPPILIGDSKKYIESEIEAWLLTQPRGAEPAPASGDASPAYKPVQTITPARLDGAAARSAE